MKPGAYYDEEFGEFFFVPDEKMTLRLWLKTAFYTLLLRIGYWGMLRDAKKARKDPHYDGPMF
jgi:hypothetical protein